MQKKWASQVLRLVFVILMMIYLKHVNYLLFHSLIEVFCVVVAASTAILAYNTCDMSNNFFFTFLGLAYGFNGFFDFLHLLAYKGMGVLGNDTSNLPTQLWVIARLLDSSSLLLATYFIGKKNPEKGKSQVILGYGLISIVLIFAVFVWHIFPDCFIEGKGLTFFKIASENLVIGILILSILVMQKKGALLPSPMKKYLTRFALVAIVAETCFTLYTDVYGYINMAGHILKVASYFLVYMALLESVLKHPYSVMREKVELASQEIENKNSQLNLQMTKLDTMEQKMSRLEKLHLVGELAASIGHEIRNPLTAIRGYLQLFSIRPEFSRHSPEFGIIISELDRANGIISEFLSLAKDSALTLQKTNLNDVIQALLPMVKANALLKGCTVEVSLDAFSRLLLDEQQIRQLLLNLIQNGLESMNNGGRLIISTAEREREVLLSIKDEGSGIPDHVLQKIGTPFVTTKPTGTGLGLAICYNIAEKHHASIEVKSSSTGTEFIIYFRK